jgi:hypothetical protein
MYLFTVAAFKKGPLYMCFDFALFEYADNPQTTLSNLINGYQHTAFPDHE